MASYAILCGSAPKGFRQKKLEEMYNFLESKNGANQNGARVITFPNGVNELILEGMLNNALEKASDETAEVLLYICAKEGADLKAELSGSAIPGIEVVRLNDQEIRKDVLAYYENLADQLDVRFRVEYAVDREFVKEEVFGYEKVAAESAKESIN
ncbi:MAG: hypothetical protein IKQ23_06825 [Treponema sp.]|nr:hypothetical protein [Treponema sp.]